MARILIVEDDPAIALALEDDLRLEGYEVQVATDGRSGSRRARDEPFDLIVLDVMLPQKDGFEVCREVRLAGIHAPVLFLTARGEEAEKLLGFEHGADDYVTKPFSPREIRARIKALLRRSTAADPEVYRFGDAEVDMPRCELRRAGRVVELTPTEFQLLTLFIRKKGRTLSREQLLNEVWGPEVHTTDRVIDTHIVNLRKKIEPHPEKPEYLVSVRAVGYRFDG
jgi:two-component system alkaline phosphatase synthesis response regulator PhoP